jgi:hypothetical protein
MLERKKVKKKVKIVNVEEKMGEGKGGRGREVHS